MNNSRLAVYESDNWSDANDSERETSRWSKASTDDSHEEMTSTLRSEASKTRAFAWQSRLVSSERHGRRHIPDEDEPEPRAWVPCARTDAFRMKSLDAPVHLHVRHEQHPPDDELARERLTINIDDLLNISVSVEERTGVGVMERFEVTRVSGEEEDDDELVHRTVSFSTDSARVEGRERVHSSGDASLLAVRRLISEAAARVGLKSDSELINSLRCLQRDGGNNGLLVSAVSGLASLASEELTVT